MAKGIFKHTLSILTVVFLSTFLLFAMIRMAPGDPVKILLGNQELSAENQKLYNEKYDEKSKEYFLDKPIVIQYITWLKQVFSFNLGNSIYSNRSVISELKEKLPATVMLTVPAVIVQVIISICLGTLSAIKQNSIIDKLIRIFCVTIASFPGFAISLLVIYLFAVKLKLYEISSMGDINRLWLPSIILGITSSPGLIRVIRTTLLDELSKPYISFLIGLNCSPFQIIKSAFRNITLPIVAIVTSNFANLIGGSVIIESVFSWPGIGKLALDSIVNKDYPMIQGYGLLILFMVIFINGITNIILVRDPINFHKKEV